MKINLPDAYDDLLKECEKRPNMHWAWWAFPTSYGEKNDENENENILDQQCDENQKRPSLYEGTKIMRVGVDMEDEGVEEVVQEQECEDEQQI